MDARDDAGLTQIGRTSSVARPSRRTFSSTMRLTDQLLGERADRGLDLRARARGTSSPSFADIGFDLVPSLCLTLLLLV